MNQPLPVVTLALALAASVTSAPALASPTAKLPNPKLTKAQATAIAKRAVKHGTIVASELEVEKGGSGLRYSFDVKDGGVSREIGVDANTGAILESAKEGTHPD